MDNVTLTVLGLGLGTFAIRLTGYLLGQRVPQTGPWARGLEALPGCLFAALVTYLLLQGQGPEWIAGALAALTAALTRSLSLTMIVGIGAVLLVRGL